MRTLTNRAGWIAAVLNLAVAPVDGGALAHTIQVKSD